MTNPSWQLSALELDVLWDTLDLGEPPFPLDVPGHGDTERERRELCQRTITELARRLSIEDDLIDSDIAVALRFLARAHYWVDSVWVTDPVAKRLVRMLVASSGGGRAAVAVQLPGDQPGSAGDLVLDLIPATALVPELISALPPEQPGGQPGGSIPASGNTDDSNAADSFLRRAGGNDDRASRTQRALHTLLDTGHARSGQIAANTRDRNGRRHRSRVVFWFDNPDDGRYLASVQPDRGGANWLTVTPARGDLLAATVRQCLTEVGVDQGSR
jgi:hypothetical protein